MEKLSTFNFAQYEAETTKAPDGSHDRFKDLVMLGDYPLFYWKINDFWFDKVCLL